MLPSAVQIEIIPHSQQRYDTCGDWYLVGGKDGTLSTLLVRVSRTPTPIYAWLVAIHETVEALLYLYNGATPEMVDEFDIQYNGHYDEPGDDPKAPYHKEHVFASALERMCAFVFGVNWQAYEEEIYSLSREEDK